MRLLAPVRIRAPVSDKSRIVQSTLKFTVRRFRPFIWSGADLRTDRRLSSERDGGRMGGKQMWLWRAVGDKVDDPRTIIAAEPQVGQKRRCLPPVSKLPG
jgi:hypothetical protein